MTRQLVEDLAIVVGADPTELDGRDVSLVAGQNLFGGSSIEVAGRSVDSLALAEVLIGIEEELDAPIFDDARMDDAVTLREMVAIVLDQTTPEVVERWLQARHGRPH